MRQAFSRWLVRAFPERQILIRELDRMSIYRLSRGTQAALAAVGIVMSGGTIAVVVALVFGAPPPRPREVSAVIANKLEVRATPGRSAGQDKHEAVVIVAEEGAEVELPISLSPPPADPAAGEPSSDEEATAEVEIEAGNDRLRAQLAAIDDRVFALATRGLGALPTAEEARARRVTGAHGVAGVETHVANIERQVERLASGVSALRDAEAVLLREIKPQLAFFISTAERVIERAGLDIDDVFHGQETPKHTAEGGPFVAAVSGPLAAERAALHADLAHWQMLRALVKRMPLAAPLDRYAVSSPFGRRRDPMNSRKAMHNGLDLISALGSPVRAPAPGKVVFAGRNGGYGNFVEIDHGKSLRTRYGHLRSIKVKKGDTVEFMQPIGTLGNSGRSTGAHLHYEVLIAGKPVNPMNFIRAGQHVFQE